MFSIDAVEWTVSPVAVEAELVPLAERCLEADGGLPMSADPDFLRRRWTGGAVTTVQICSTREPSDDATELPRGPTDAVACPPVPHRPVGRLLAAGAVRPTSGDGSDPWAGGATFVGLVDPEVRACGLGSRLLDWGLAEGRRRGGSVTVETESLTGESLRLFEGRGLRQVFAEDVLRFGFDVGARRVPEAVWPGGTTFAAWSDANAERFFRVYEAAFRERPGFPGWNAERWIAWVTGDDEFRPEWSVLATVPTLGGDAGLGGDVGLDHDVGFVIAAVGWIVQVGVVPAARGRGLGSALVTEVLRRMRAGGADEAWLDVNVDNPAGRLYRRLGFEDRGRRARFRAG